MIDRYDWFDDDGDYGRQPPRFQFIVNQGFIDTLFDPRDPKDQAEYDKSWKLAAEIIAKAKSDRTAGGTV